MDVEAKVTIQTASGTTKYKVRVPETNEDNSRDVLCAGVEMACALLGAPYRKDESDYIGKRIRRGMDTG
jgi:hypothetical protein